VGQAEGSHEQNDPPHCTCDSVLWVLDTGSVFLQVAVPHGQRRLMFPVADHLRLTRAAPDVHTREEP